MVEWEEREYSEQEITDALRRCYALPDNYLIETGRIQPVELPPPADASGSRPEPRKPRITKPGRKHRYPFYNAPK